MTRKPRVAIVGAGSLATFLAKALSEFGYRVTEIVSRDSPHSRARALASKVRARAVTEKTASLDAELLWFCVPDRVIHEAASSLAARTKGKVRFAFHSSGALLSGELASLRVGGSAVASVHPLMTFVPGSHPALAGVPFALEGDATALRLARQIVRDLGGESFVLPAEHKAAYHAWATLTSPLWLAFLVTLEEAAGAAGLAAVKARRMSLPIIRQTLENNVRLGPEHSFSGPIIRGDATTVAQHLALLKKHLAVRDVYVALARAALDRLPARNQKQLRRLLRN